MNKKDFAKLCFNYNKEPNEDLYEIWDFGLRAFDENEIKQAFYKIITTDKFFPSLNRVLEVVKEIVLEEEIDFNSETVARKKMERNNIKPKWLDKEIINEPIDEESEKIFIDFQNFIKEY